MEMDFAEMLDIAKASGATKVLVRRGDYEFFAEFPAVLSGEAAGANEAPAETPVPFKRPSFRVD